MTVRIITGDCRDVLPTLPADHFQCCVTSPPYWGLRDYGVGGQIGLERSINEYVEIMVGVFREVRRVLRDDGTLWLNLGDCYHSGDRGGYRNDAHRWEKSDLQRGNRGNAETIRPNRLPQDGIKDKDLVGIPWRVAFALQADGWYLRQDIIWAKPNPMPESVRDRCTKSHEYLFLLSKSGRYYYDSDAIKESASPGTHERRPRGGPNVSGWASGPGSHSTIEHTKPREVGVGPKLRPRKAAPNGSGTKNNASFDAAMAVMPATRNKRDVWTVVTQGFPEAHFATFPPALIEPCILAGCPEGGTVLDPFGGAGTTGLVADRHHRNAILIELSPDYVAMAERRVRGDAPLFAEVST